MPDYQTGHVKRDPVTGAVAIRTIFPEAANLPVDAWLVASTSNGAKDKSTADVDHWDDIYVPGPSVLAKRIEPLAIES